MVAEMCKGKSNKEIARTLGMAESTVKLHLTDIFEKMEVKTRTQAIIKASDFVVATPEPLTDQQILEKFVDTMLESRKEPWSQRVIKFGRNLLQTENK